MKIEFISSLSKVKGGDCLEPHLGKDPAATGPGLLLTEQYEYHLSLRLSELQGTPLSS